MLAFSMIAFHLDYALDFAFIPQSSHISTIRALGAPEPHNNLNNQMGDQFKIVKVLTISSLTRKKLGVIIIKRPVGRAYP